MHIAVDVKTKQILAIEVAKEDVGGGKMFGRLVRGSANVADLRSVVGDRVYDSRANFCLAAGVNVELLIGVCKSASFKADGCMSCRFAVVGQLGNSEWGV